MERLAKNLKTLRDSKKLSQDSLAIQLGITRARIGSYEEDRNDPPIEILNMYSNFFAVSLDAIVKGDFTKTSPNQLMQIDSRLLFPITVDKEGNDMIEVVPLKAVAGYLSGHQDPEYVEKLQRISLPFPTVGKHRAFPIKGDSMPPLKEGAFVVCKFVESIKDIRDGNTYVLLTKNGELVYKRIFTDSLKKDGIITASSDNPAYPPYPIKVEDTLEAWEYVGALSVGQYKPDVPNEAILDIVRQLQTDVEKLKNKGGS